MGDSTNNDVKDSDEIAPGVNPGIDLRFTRALPDSRLTFGIGGKFLYSSNDENFVGRDIQPFTR